jgi:hypothetical protein
MPSSSKRVGDTDGSSNGVSGGGVSVDFSFYLGCKKMSNEGFRGVPGVPDGWELVHANRIVEAGEWYINAKGKPEQASVTSGSTWAIIRKIETPAKYRHFANAEEFRPHRDRWLTRKASFDPSPIDGAWRVCSYDDDGVWWANARKSTYQEEFDSGRCFDDDGTPFGVRIDE